MALLTTKSGFVGRCAAGGDEGRIGAADWQEKIFMTAEANGLLRQIREVLGGEAQDNDDLIAVAELLTYVVMASVRAKAWKGELVLYVSDNHPIDHITSNMLKLAYLIRYANFLIPQRISIFLYVNRFKKLAYKLTY